MPRGEGSLRPVGGFAHQNGMVHRFEHMRWKIINPKQKQTTLWTNTVVQRARGKLGVTIDDTSEKEPKHMTRHVETRLTPRVL